MDRPLCAEGNKEPNFEKSWWKNLLSVRGCRLAGLPFFVDDDASGAYQRHAEARSKLVLTGVGGDMPPVLLIIYFLLKASKLTKIQKLLRQH